MHKKTYIHELDIPKDDFDCWNRYPKYRWVYDHSRLFDAQGIKWAPWASDGFNDSIPNLTFNSDREYETSNIFCNIPSGNNLHTEVYIVKGEIKYLRHLDKEEIDGGVEIRISAFVSMHFHKFTGVLSVETHGNDITHISLMPRSDLSIDTNVEAIRLLKRIFKRHTPVCSGPTDQVHQEALAS